MFSGKKLAEFLISFAVFSNDHKSSYLYSNVSILKSSSVRRLGLRLAPESWIQVIIPEIIKTSVEYELRAKNEASRASPALRRCAFREGACRVIFGSARPDEFFEYSFCMEHIRAHLKHTGVYHRIDRDKVRREQLLASKRNSHMMTYWKVFVQVYMENGYLILTAIIPNPPDQSYWLNGPFHLPAAGKSPSGDSGLLYGSGDSVRLPVLSWRLPECNPKNILNKFSVAKLTHLQSSQVTRKPKAIQSTPNTCISMIKSRRSTRQTRRQRVRTTRRRFPSRTLRQSRFPLGVAFVF
ncbi:hypothetical protein HUJ05_006463 [Dendroctonus ponderosae]|nr:hypothetical protein HUJ05_006463 [Dendroctonus ponderosae]